MENTSGTPDPIFGDQFDLALLLEKLGKRGKEDLFNYVEELHNNGHPYCRELVKHLNNKISTRVLVGEDIIPSDSKDIGALSSNIVDWKYHEDVINDILYVFRDRYLEKFERSSENPNYKIVQEKLPRSPKSSIMFPYESDFTPKPWHIISISNSSTTGFTNVICTEYQFEISHGLYEGVVNMILQESTDNLDVIIDEDGKIRVETILRYIQFAAEERGLFFKRVVKDGKKEKRKWGGISLLGRYSLFFFSYWLKYADVDIPLQYKRVAYSLVCAIEIASTLFGHWWWRKNADHMTKKDYVQTHMSMVIINLISIFNFKNLYFTPENEIDSIKRILDNFKGDENQTFDDIFTTMGESQLYQSMLLGASYIIGVSCADYYTFKQKVIKSIFNLYPAVILYESLNNDELMVKQWAVDLYIASKNIFDTLSSATNRAGILNGALETNSTTWQNYARLEEEFKKQFQIVGALEGLDGIIIANTTDFINDFGVGVNSSLTYKTKAFMERFPRLAWYLINAEIFYPYFDSTHQNFNSTLKDLYLGKFENGDKNKLKFLNMAWEYGDGRHERTASGLSFLNETASQMHIYTFVLSFLAAGAQTGLNPTFLSEQPGIPSTVKIGNQPWEVVYPTSIKPYKELIGHTWDPSLFGVGLDLAFLFPLIYETLGRPWMKEGATKKRFIPSLAGFLIPSAYEMGIRNLQYKIPSYWSTDTCNPDEITYGLLAPRLINIAVFDCIFRKWNALQNAAKSGSYPVSETSTEKLRGIDNILETNNGVKVNFKIDNVLFENIVVGIPVDMQRCFFGNRSKLTVYEKFRKAVSFFIQNNLLEKSDLLLNIEFENTRKANETKRVTLQSLLGTIIPESESNSDKIHSFFPTRSIRWDTATERIWYPVTIDESMAIHTFYNPTFKDFGLRIFGSELDMFQILKAKVDIGQYEPKFYLNGLLLDYRDLKLPKMMPWITCNFLTAYQHHFINSQVELDNQVPLSKLKFDSITFNKNTRYYIYQLGSPICEHLPKMWIGKDDFISLPFLHKDFFLAWRYLKISFKPSQARNVLEFLFNIAYVEYFKLNRVGTLGNYKRDIEAKDFEYIRAFFLILASEVDTDEFHKRFTDTQNLALSEMGQRALTTEYVAQRLLKEVEKSNNLHLHHWLNETLTNFRNSSRDSGDTGDRMVKAWEYFLKHGIQITNSEPAASVSSLRARFMAKYHPATD